MVLLYMELSPVSLILVTVLCVATLVYVLTDYFPCMRPISLNCIPVISTYQRYFGLPDASLVQVST